MVSVNLEKWADALITLGLCAMFFACGVGIGAGYMTKTAMIFQAMGAAIILLSWILDAYAKYKVRVVVTRRRF